MEVKIELEGTTIAGLQQVECFLAFAFPPATSISPCFVYLYDIAPVSMPEKAQGQTMTVGSYSDGLIDKPAQQCDTSVYEQVFGSSIIQQVVLGVKQPGPMGATQKTAVISLRSLGLVVRT